MLGIDRKVVMLAIFEVSAVATVGGLPLTFLFLLIVMKPSLSWLGSGRPLSGHWLYAWLRPRLGLGLGLGQGLGLCVSNLAGLDL